MLRGDVEFTTNMRVKMAFNHVPSDNNEPCKGCWFKDNPFFDCKQLQRKLLIPRFCQEYDEDTGELTYTKLEAVQLVNKKYYKD